jgi:chemotaxis protein methyltransferase CheR
MALTTNTQTPTATLSRTDYAYVTDLLEQHAAIDLGPDKQYLVEQRLSALARAEQLDSIAALLIRARADQTGRVVKLVVDAMTTNETSFFRDPTVYEFLRAELLPELIERNRTRRQLRLWCGACSSGQEPYSIAMMLREYFPDIANSWNVRILATDLSSTMLERTREGAYSRIEVNRGLPASYLVKYFTRRGRDWQISEDIRDSVEVREINLARPFPFSEQFDLVLLRNVLIYFSVDTKRLVLDRMRRALAPGGSLILGATESTMHIDNSWARRTYGNVSCYQIEDSLPEEARP